MLYSQTMMSALDELVITRTSAAQQIADALSQMVIAGELEPGQRLRESALATRLAVSRNTIREAVRILEQGRLIRIEVGRGAVVRPLDPEDLSDVYGVRELLELTAIRESRGADLSGVRDALQAFEAAAARGGTEETVECDLAFHASIVATLHRPRLDQFFAELCAELRFFLAVISVADHETERPAELVEQHTRVLRAWEAGDRRHAAARLRDHIRSNADRACALLLDRTQ